MLHKADNQIHSLENNYNSEGKKCGFTHKIKPMYYYLAQTPTSLTERHNQDHLFRRQNKTVIGRVSVVELSYLELESSGEIRDEE